MEEISGMKKKQTLSFHSKSACLLFSYSASNLGILKTSIKVIHKATLAISPIATSFFPYVNKFIANRATHINLMPKEKTFVCLLC